MKRRRKRTLSRAAISSGLAIVPMHYAGAQEAASPTAPDTVQTTIQEIIVTAQRRETSIEQIPYNISAIGGDELTRTGTTDLRQLATEVPGFDMLDRGGQFEGSTVPIIRGLNASSTVRPGLMFEQSPVATYIGNSPVEGFFPIDDLQRVEILRGPQGTLYGAGALGGAIRLLPNDPILGTWAANLSGSGGGGLMDCPRSAPIRPAAAGRRALHAYACQSCSSPRAFIPIIGSSLRSSMAA